MKAAGKATKAKTATTATKATTFALVALVAFVVSSTAGSFSSSGVGTTSGSFLKLGAGARAMAMGEAYSALADDGTSLYWNPAAMVQSPDRHSLSFMHAEYLAGISYEYLGYVYKAKENTALGAGLQYLSYGDIPETDASGVQTGNFHPQDLALSLGGGFGIEDPENLLQGFSLGASLKYVRSQIVSHANTATADLGLLSPRYLKDRLRLALVGQNLFGTLKFDQVAEPLPSVIKLGASYHMRPNWLWGLDLQFPRDNQVVVALGTEYVMDLNSKSEGRKGKELAVAGRLGYNSRTAGDIDGFTGISFGIGLISKRLGSLDYALVPFGGLGLTHRISLSLRLGAGEKSGPPSGTIK